MLPLGLALLSFVPTSVPILVQETGRPAVPKGSAVTHVRGGLLFDGLSGEVVPNPGITIAEGRITAIGERDGAGPTATILELGDADTPVCIVPGLVDLHAHYAMDLFGKGRVDERDGNPLVFLANGVTTTFPAGEVDPQEMAELRRAIDRGERIGPRILGSGPYFGRWRRGWNRKLSEAELRAEVDHWVDEGVSCFKAKGIGPEHLEALIDQAHSRGARVTGHLDSGHRNSVNPRDAIHMGIDRVEHFLGGDAFPADRSAYASLVEFDPASEDFARIAALFVEKGVYFDATLSAYGYYGERDPEVFTPWVDEADFFTPFVRQLVAERPPREPSAQFEKIYQVKHGTLRAFHEAGGADLITVGTDHPSTGEYLAGFAIHREMLCFVRAGLEPADVLKCATINGARALGLEDELGTIEVGKLADFLIVRGNPLEDIRHLRGAVHVVKEGVVYDPAELLKSVRGMIGPASEDEAEAWKP